MSGAGVREDLEGGQERDGADRSVDPEDGLPAGPGREGSSDEDTCGDTHAADGTPQGESRAALGAGVGGHDQRQRGRRHEGRGQALTGAGRDQLGGIAGEAAEYRRAGEQGKTGQEDPPARQQVGDAAAEQQASAGHHQVGGDQPLQVAAAQVQGLTDRGQRGVDDGDVEDDEDLRGQGDGQHRPRLARTVGFDVVLRTVGVVVSVVGGGDGVGCSFGGGHGGSRFQEVVPLTVDGLRCAHPGQVAGIRHERRAVGLLTAGWAVVRSVRG